MTEQYGFTLVEERTIEELRSTARFWRHNATGAQLISMLNDDENKVFGAVFRTPPRDSTGVAHILEHSVLCGSRKYPVKEPFVELLKGSMQTFLNAFTYPDKTCYPVASTNHKDFYNLVDVYLDAVFHPRITPEIFKQEGWHLEPADMESGDISEMIFKGVVYNEMKGAYSSPDSVLMEKTQQSIFPDVTYGLDSGGDPAVIPELTYEAFREFHATYYHPSNTRFWFYGDDNEEDRLKKLAEFLDEYQAIEVDSSVPLQAGFSEPREVRAAYADDGDGRAMTTVNWLLTETTDTETNIGLEMLEQVLVGMPASPLRKALIESGLGEDIAGVGLEHELRQMYFSTGLKGIREEDADRVRGIVIETLERLAAEGVPAEVAEAAVNSVEFDMRENNTGRFPRGLSVMLHSMTTWLYDGDPFALLAYEGPLAAVKARVAEGGYFESLIRRFFLENSHRTRVLLVPDSELAARREAEEADRVRARTEGLDDAARRALADEAAELLRLQQAHDSPEALATIPRLKVADLDRENRTLPIEVVEEGGATLLTHDIGTDGIVYFDLGFDLRTVRQELLPLVPLFGRALLEMGTDKEDFVTLNMRIARKTGGIGASPAVYQSFDGPAPDVRLMVRSKATRDNMDELLAILSDVLLHADFSDRDRFRQIVLEEKARQEHSLIPSGHMVVISRLRARFGEAGWLDDIMNGVSHLFELRALADAVENDWDGVRASLEEIRSALITRAGTVVNVTMDTDMQGEFLPKVHSFLGGLPQAASERQVWTPSLNLPAREGLTLPAQVNYVGKGADLGALGYEYHGAVHVIAKLLRTSWLWDKIRVQGGAYGAFCAYDRVAGTFSYASYRDPNIASTLGVYDGSGAFLRAIEEGSEELAKSIVGAISDIDSHLLPDAKGYASMVRHLSGDTDERRQAMRDQVLTTTAAHVREFADVLDRAAEASDVVILGGRSTLDSVRDELGLEITKVM